MLDGRDLEPLRDALRRRVKAAEKRLLERDGGRASFSSDLSVILADTVSMEALLVGRIAVVAIRACMAVVPRVECVAVEFCD